LVRTDILPPPPRGDKFEIRISKSETNPNVQMSKCLMNIPSPICILPLPEGGGGYRWGRAF